MDICPQYVPPVVEYEVKIKRELFLPSVQLYEAGKFEESFRTFLRYVNEEAALACETSPNHWVIPHGSIVVEINITPEGMLEITAPFVKLPPDKRAPLLRQVLELNTNTLTLPRLVLRDDGLTFEFRCPIQLAEPNKMYRVLFEICINGDSLDDEYVTKFGAVPLREKQVTVLPEEQVERAWQVYSSTLAEAKRAADYYMSKRWSGFAFEILGIALMQLDHVIAWQGFLRTRMERTIQHLWDQRSPEDIHGLLARDIEEYMNIDRATFAADFYRADFFINAKKSAEIEACRKSMNQRWEWAREDRSRRNNHGVAICYLFAAYEVLYNYFVPQRLHEELAATLTAMSGQEWEAAGEHAWASFQKIMDPAFE